MKFKFPKIDSKAIGRTFDIIGKFGKEHLPAILTICGIIGVTGSIVLTANAVKKSEEDIRQAEAEANDTLQNEDDWVEMPRKEKIKLCWKHYIPAVGVYICSVVLIIAGQKVSLGRLAAVTGLLQLRTKDFEELKKKIIEKDGKEKFEEYRNSIVNDRYTGEPNGMIYDTKHGNTIFYDPMTGMFFYSDIWHVERAVIHLIEAIKNENYYELSDFHSDLDLPKSSCGQFFAFMYSANSDLKIDKPDAFFDYMPVDADNGDKRPCIYLDYISRLDPSYMWEEEIRMKTPY